jgi:hypothetical protein
LQLATRWPAYVIPHEILSSATSLRRISYVRLSNSYVIIPQSPPLLPHAPVKNEDTVRKTWLRERKKMEEGRVQ